MNKVNASDMVVNIPLKNSSTIVSKHKNFANKNNVIINGIRKSFIHLKLKWSLIKIAMNSYKNPIDWIRSLNYLVTLRRKFLGNNRLQKIVCANGKYYMGLYTPGWNSAVYKQFIRSQLNDFKKIKHNTNRFNAVFVAITKKCALQCEHCYEWDNLNKKDFLDFDKIKQIVLRLQNQGVSQIQFLGGEPLLKMDVLEQVLLTSKKSTDFWITTSGFKLNGNNAKRLNLAGLTGVIISLDHYMPEKHNEFRGFKEAFYWVEEAIKNAHNNNLVVALSICITKEFISELNLNRYMQLAKELGVSFVQFLEPRPVGHFAKKDVLLGNSEIELLESFFLKMNFNQKYSSFPIITYHGYYQRRQGCYSAGIKGMYVDSDGDMNACPFCHKKTGNVLNENFENNLAILKKEGCHNYN